MLLAVSWLGLSSFLFAFILTPLTRDVFARLGFVDDPTGGRKLHSAPVPRVGGVAIAISIALSLGLTAAAGIWTPFLYNPSIQLLIKLLPSAAVIFLIGLLDDLTTLKPWQKLLGQLLGAVLAYASGLQVMGIAGYATPSWVSLPVTVAWLLLCTNAFNLIDGVDGLATGAGLFATLTMLLAGVLEKNSALLLATVPLGAALLGFLRYNFNPATVFLGDCGSLFDGLWNGRATDGDVCADPRRHAFRRTPFPAWTTHIRRRPRSHAPQAPGPGIHAKAGRPPFVRSVRFWGSTVASSDDSLQPVQRPGHPSILRGDVDRYSAPGLFGISRRPAHAVWRNASADDQYKRSTSRTRGNAGILRILR